MFNKIIKRDGREVDYNIEKIRIAIENAMKAGNRNNFNDTEMLALKVESKLAESFIDTNPSVEDIQDMVESVLMDNGYAFIAKKYILYRSERTKAREMNTRLMRIYDELTFTDAKDSDTKRDNANIDGDTAMGTMLKYGSEGAKDYYEKYLLTDEQRKAHKNGDIHIHDFDFYSLTMTCCQIDLIKLFKNGFSTGHGFLREPNDISSYSALACIAIQSNQNDQHGGQSIPAFDYAMALGVKKTYKKIYGINLYKALSLLQSDYPVTLDEIKGIINKIEKQADLRPSLYNDKNYKDMEKQELSKLIKNADVIDKAQEFAEKTSLVEIDKAVYQAMEAFVHNLNTMHSRAGAQTPFSSINYGTDTSLEGRMVTKNIMLATKAGLGNGETAIFPIHIFKVKEGINYNVDDPNYDLFRLACEVSAERLYPNFSFIDAPFNKQYYKEGRPETEIAYMGCRTRVMGNVYDSDNEITYGRGNLSFSTINLPRIAIKSNGNIDIFFEDLERKMELVSNQLLDRFKIQCGKKVKNFPFLMGQGLWIGSDKLGFNDSIKEVLGNGTLSIGFIGLAETLIALTGKHHGESKESANLGLEIVSFMREFLDNKSQDLKLNFSLLATPAEGLSGRFVKMDRKQYGVIEGVTDKDYYTNSFHIPVSFKISAYNKINTEAPYHALTNAGHISYVELDGDAACNIDAYMKIVRTMKDAGVGYGSINHPVDRDPICGYNGIIKDECPKCNRLETDGDIGFERIRRITGYLVGTLDRFNDAKKAEERDRIKHNV